MLTRHGVLDRGSNITITSYNGYVLIVGTAANDLDLEVANGLVSQIEGVRRIYNEMTTESRRTAAENDAALLDRARAEVTAEYGVLPVVYDGDMFLMGIVTKDQGYQDALAVSDLPSVKRVVQIYEIASSPEQAEEWRLRLREKSNTNRSKAYEDALAEADISAYANNYSTRKRNAGRGEAVDANKVALKDGYERWDYTKIRSWVCPDNGDTANALASESVLRGESGEDWGDDRYRYRRFGWGLTNVFYGAYREELRRKQFEIKYAVKAPAEWAPEYWGSGEWQRYLRTMSYDHILPASKIYALDEAYAIGRGMLGKPEITGRISPYSDARHGWKGKSIDEMEFWSWWPRKESPSAKFGDSVGVYAAASPGYMGQIYFKDRANEYFQLVTVPLAEKVTCDAVDEARWSGASVAEKAMTLHQVEALVYKDDDGREFPILFRATGLKLKPMKDPRWGKTKREPSL